MKKKSLLLYVVALLTCPTIYSQNNNPDSSSVLPIGIPVSFNHPEIGEILNSPSLTSITLPNLINSNLKSTADSLELNCTQCAHLKYYATGIINTIDLKNSAQYYNPNINNGKLWILKITSPTALGLQFYFSKFNLPDEAFFHIYNSEQVVLGPYSSVNNPQDSTKPIQFGTIPIEGNEVFLEYFESDSAEFSGSIIIENIGHVFTAPFPPTQRTPGGLIDQSAPCQKDAICKVGWEPEINSVAQILQYDLNINFYGVSTGVLINNTSEDGTPYFLTAAHTYNYSAVDYDISTWNFRFDFENLTCLPSFLNTSPNSYQVVYGGSTLLSQDQLDVSNPYNVVSINSDYLLLKLNTTALALSTMGLCYSGWTKNSPLTSAGFSSSNEFTLIHHPNGDVKKISVGNNLIQSNTVGTWTPANIYKLSITYGGGLEIGSSGCPLYNSNHKIVATSSGHGSFLGTTYDPCNTSSTGSQFFGRFDRHWALGNFKQWLDPLNKTDVSTYDGPTTYCPNPNAQVLGSPTLLFYQNISQGFLVNGRTTVSGEIPTFCSTDNNDILNITPAVGNVFSVDGYTRRSKCSSVTSFTGSYYTGCTEVRHLGLFFGKCDCNYYSYSVFIYELDYNGQIVSSASKFYEHHTWSSGHHSKSGFTVNVPDVLGHSFVPGKFYRVGISNISYGVIYFHTQDLYILPNSVTVSNNINQNIYAINAITMQNSNVINPIQVVATNRVEILPNSVLEAGEYFTENIDCNSFRAPESSNNQENVNRQYMGNSNNSDYGYGKPEQNEKRKIEANEDIEIVPNPNDGTFQVSVTKNNQPIGIKEIKVHDILGKVIWEEGSSSNNTFSIDITGYARGIYYVRTINENGEISMKKLIKK